MATSIVIRPKSWRRRSRTDGHMEVLVQVLVVLMALLVNPLILVLEGLVLVNQSLIPVVTQVVLSTSRGSGCGS